MNLLELHPLGPAAGDVPGDLPRVEAAVLDEPAARLVAAADRSCDVDARAGRFERRLVIDGRTKAIISKLQAELYAEEAVIRVIPRRRQHPVVLDVLHAFRGLDQE